MANYSYKWHGVNRKGQILCGELDAQNKTEVITVLQLQYIRTTKIQRQFNLPRKLQFKLNRRVSSRDICKFTRQLATLLHAGIPLLQSFEILKRGESTLALLRIIQKLYADIESGMAFNQALRQHIEFNSLYCNLVTVGELAGMLDKSLDNLANHLEKIETLHATIRSALVYPASVLGVAGIVFFIIFSFVVPTFRNIFTSFGAELPWLTRCIITLSDTIHQHGLWLLTALSIFVWWLRKQISQRFDWQLFLHQRLLQMPIAGTLIRNVCIARWTRTLATLFASGVALTEALDAAQVVTGNLFFQATTETIKKQLIQGYSLSRALENTGNLFPPMVGQMCAIGEESGTLEHMLKKTAEHYEREVSNSVAKLSTLLEPFTILVLGLLIAGLVIALYLPIFQLGQVV